MATKANLIVDQGTTFSTDLTMTDDNGDPLVLSGFTVASQMRKWYTSSNAAAVFAASSNVYSGVITLSLTSTQTGSLTPGRYVYDVEMTETVSNTVSRIVEGIVTVTPQVTR